MTRVIYTNSLSLYSKDEVQEVQDLFARVLGEFQSDAEKMGVTLNWASLDVENNVDNVSYSGSYGSVLTLRVEGTVNNNE